MSRERDTQLPARDARLPAYTVRRSSRARRARVTITEEGRAIVVLPHGAPHRAAAELVAHHTRWIERQLELAGTRSRALAARPSFGAGRTIPLEGVPHCVVLLPAQSGRSRSTVHLDDVRRIITIAQGTADVRTAPEIVEAWLRALARRWISERVSELAAELRVTPSTITIRDQRSRWGSASHLGTLSFSWRLVLCPREVFDYVVVHELAHLKVRGHSARFWSLVARHSPAAPAARRWLREHHSELRHALD